MQAKLGTFNKEKNSTKRPDSNWGINYNVVLKEGTSVFKPTLILNTSNIYNYCIWNGRCYFVENIIYATNDTTEYYLSEDVLATWKIEIELSNQYVTRNANRYDSLIIDGNQKAKASTSSTTILLDSLESKVHNPLDSGKGYWIVGVIGSSTVDSGCVSYYVLTATGFRNLMGYAFNILNYGISSTEVSYGLQKVLADPMQYIVSAMWYPFYSTPGGTSQYVDLGFLQTQIGGFLLSPTERNLQFASGAIELPLHPQRTTHGFYLCNSAPYTQYLLNAYMFGTIPLNPMDFPFNDEGKKICYVSIRCDMFTGKGQLFVANYSGELVYQGAADMGVPAILSNMTQSSGLGSVVSNIMPFVGAASSAIQSKISGALGVDTGSIEDLGSSKTGVLSNIISATQSMGIKCGFSGSQGSSIAYEFAPRICATFIDMVDIDPSIQGRPLCKTVRIGDLNGFTMTENTELDFACTPSEHDSIVSYMEGGFYRE